MPIPSPYRASKAAVKAMDYAGFRARQAKARGEGRHLGIGFCSVVESTTYGSKFYKAAGIPGSGHEAAWLRIEPGGAVQQLSAAPEFIWELGLGIYLIVKGFKSSPSTAGVSTR